jgi:tRNA(adenine34) deaminase
MSASIDGDADERVMRECLREAAAAEAAGEVPVGAAVVHGGRIIARGRNMPIATCDPTAHAELVALRAAAAVLGNYRLLDAELFVTVEPCAMCVGAALHARVRRIVYGCDDTKAGALGGAFDLQSQPGLNHRAAVRAGVGAMEARALLRGFFHARRRT